MKTELIASWRLQPMIGKLKQDMIIVTTVSGATVWVTKASFDTNAEQITYKMMKAGDPYTNTKGEEAKLTADRNEFVGAGKQVIKKYSTFEILDHLVAKGITPTFSMS